MTKFLLLRHGESVTNKGNKFCGQLDAKLSDVGLAQAEEACEYIVNNYKIDKIYSSDLMRAVQTASPVSKKLNIEIIHEPKLREIDAGVWQDNEIACVRERFPETFNRYRNGDVFVKLGDAESFNDVYLRAKEALNNIALKHPNETVLVATHGGVVRMLCEHWLNISDLEMRRDYDIKNASITEVDYDGKTAKINFISKADYLNVQTCDVGYGLIFNTDKK